MMRRHIAWNNHLFPPTGGFLPLSSLSAHPLERILYSFHLSNLNIECGPHPSSLKGICMTEPIKQPVANGEIASQILHSLRHLISN
jgi:hypothetical protein